MTGMNFDLTILIQFANLLILMILLNILLFKPVIKAMNRREQTIGSRFDKAASTKEMVDTLKKSYEDSIKEKKRPIVEEKDMVIIKAHTDATQIIEKARADLTDEIAQIRIDMENESKKVHQTLIMDVEKLSGEVAQKILKRSIS
jgi:F-type H+-transporting ATPase subunit b